MRPSARASGPALFRRFGWFVVVPTNSGSYNKGEKKHTFTAARYSNDPTTRGRRRIPHENPGLTGSNSKRQATDEGLDQAACMRLGDPRSKLVHHLTADLAAQVNDRWLRQGLSGDHPYLCYTASSAARRQKRRVDQHRAAICTSSKCRRTTGEQQLVVLPRAMRCDAMCICTAVVRWAKSRSLGWSGTKDRTTGGVCRESENVETSCMKHMEYSRTKALRRQLRRSYVHTVYQRARL